MAFEQMQFSSTVDVDVKIASGDNASNTAIKLFSTKNIIDHLYVTLPTSIDINTFNYIFLQSDVIDAPIASVWLK